MTFRGVTGDLKRLGVRPSKNLGQNFLRDGTIAEWMVSEAGIGPHDRVLEIGPGLGILTEKLATATDRLVVVELDRRLAENMKKAGMNVIQGDALEIELPDFDICVSNLPYQISSGITMKLLDKGFKKAVLMFQKEFAEHLVARPGESTYSRISVMAGYRSESSIIRHVSKGCFYPVPKVDSAIVQIVPKAPDFEIKDEKTFRETVRILFSHKNRKARNGIMSEHQALDLSKDGAKELAEILPYMDERPITLSAKKLADISNAIFERKGAHLPSK